jgi:hypothetical protein
MKCGAVPEVGLRSGSEARVLEKHVRIITCRLSGSLMARVVIWVEGASKLGIKVVASCRALRYPLMDDQS